jgi:hypothetical protein
MMASKTKEKATLTAAAITAMHAKKAWHVFTIETAHLDTVNLNSAQLHLATTAYKTAMKLMLTAEEAVKTVQQLYTNHNHLKIKM